MTVKRAVRKHDSIAVENIPPQFAKRFSDNRCLFLTSLRLTLGVDAFQLLYFVLVWIICTDKCEQRFFIGTKSTLFSGTHYYIAGLLMYKKCLY